ncbi:MAG: TatD family nuclease-associated radical SAM protein [Firmicutes bacterium]|nr:TatD family nuclease-associated radical SAM protein [Bacillota bacterium]
MSNIYTYKIGENLYINLTNKCNCQCSFCVRNNGDIFGHKLWLDNEPNISQVINEVKTHAKLSNIKEIVFCGFGEPTYRIESIIEIAKALKALNIPIRIDTNGHGDLINSKNIVPLIKGLIDAVSVSLNAPNKKRYDELVKSIFDNAYEAMIQFVKDCIEFGIKTILTVVDILSEEEKKECEKIAKELGAEFRVRQII